MYEHSEHGRNSHCKLNLHFSASTPSLVSISCLRSERRDLVRRYIVCTNSRSMDRWSVLMARSAISDSWRRRNKILYTILLNYNWLKRKKKKGINFTKSKESKGSNILEALTLFPSDGVCRTVRGREGSVGSTWTVRRYPSWVEGSRWVNSRQYVIVNERPWMYSSTRMWESKRSSSNWVKIKLNTTVCCHVN